MAITSRTTGKLTPNLTLNFGLRYEYFSPPVQRGKATNFDLNGFMPVRQTFHGFPDIPDTTDRPAALVYADKNDFGPRFGFAYSHAMDSRFRASRRLRHVLHAGDHELLDDAHAESSHREDVRLHRQRDQSHSRWKRLRRVLARRDLVSSDRAQSIRICGPSYTQQWNLTAQKRLPKDIYFDLGYVGSKGTQLTATYDGNRPIQIVTPGPGVAPVASRRPFQGFDTINVTKSIGNSNYHSMQMKAERRSARGLTVLGSYTWSHSISNADISSVGGGAFLAAHSGLHGPARQPVGFCLRYPAPAIDRGDLRCSVCSGMHRSGWCARFLGGWQLGTIITAQTGFAAALAGVVDTTGTGVVSRPDMIAGQDPMLDRGDRTRERWFNTAAFALPQPGSFGTAPRHPIHLPGLNQVDASATKNFRFTESQQLQFRAEFFNAFNHVNLGAPGLNIRDPDNFGRVTSTSQGAGMAGRFTRRAVRAQVQLLTAAGAEVDPFTSASDSPT